MRLPLILGLLAALVLAACGGQTNPPANVTTTSAVLTADGTCDAGQDGQHRFKYRAVGATSWQYTSYSPTDAQGPVVCPATGFGNREVTGLQPDTEYEYFVEWRETEGTVWTFDSDGHVNDQAVHPERFRTAAPPPPADTTPPEVVPDFRQNTVTQTSIELLWDETFDDTAVTAYVLTKDGAPLAEVDDTTFEYVASGLTADTSYTFTIRARDAAGNLSDPASLTARTAAPPPPPPPATGSLYLTPAEVAALPAPPSNVVTDANAAGPCTPNVSNQDDKCSTYTLAAALVGKRNNDATLIEAARANIVAARGSESGSRALALGREVAALVIAADLIGERSTATQDWFRKLLTHPTTSGPSNLVACHEQRPNNWGTMCGASRIAIHAFLGDKTGLDRAWNVFQGYVGDRSKYAGFSYGELSWQSNPSAPVGINPVGATIQGHDVDGVQPDDQRRTGSFTWPPVRSTSYPWEALQGSVLQAVLLQRQGYPAYAASSSALKRAVGWLYRTTFSGGGNWPATSDDAWLIPVVNKAYGTSHAPASPSWVGKNVGYTNWANPA